MNARIACKVEIRPWVFFWPWLQTGEWHETTFHCRVDEQLRAMQADQLNAFLGNIL